MGLPELLEVDVAWLMGPVDAKTAMHQQFDHAGRLGVEYVAIFVSLRQTDHHWVAAEVHLRALRVELQTAVTFKSS